MLNMKTSLIISTYNWPEALTLCLKSVAAQSRRPDEVLVADDGSRGETRRTVMQIAEACSLPLRHIWHEDNGFRLSAIRNRAMAAASGDYIIQIDGDLILHPDFVADHIRMADRGWFVVGSRAILGESLSRRLLGSAAALDAANPAPPAAIGALCGDVRNRLNAFRLPLLTGLLKNRRGHGARGCNMAFWRDDVLTVNGYDENMTGWGHEDKEFAARLRNAGIGQHTLKFGGIVWHLHHREAERSRENINLEMLHRTEREALVRCENGIDKYL